ncbi:hypothetical protein Zmor_009331 [Zophobas morio]|uniref:Uncharacterized protein n=1 Tax=Zophobas morio TaxID=2755281 RepID=A0AA38IL02_9CUCU|nr:hypothetical protein Zmor_009331 [Zophobas morio]
MEQYISGATFGVSNLTAATIYSHICALYRHCIETSKVRSDARKKGCRRILHISVHNAEYRDNIYIEKDTPVTTRYGLEVQIGRAMANIPSNSASVYYIFQLHNTDRYCNSVGGNETSGRE